MSAFEFPAFLKLEYRTDGSAKNGFLRAVDDTLAAGERRFDEFSAEARRQVDRALSVDRNAFGSLNLGANEARDAARAAQARASAARELATATALAAREEGDFSQNARLAAAAMEAEAIEAEQAARAALSHAQALEQVQTVLNRQTSATEAVIGATRRGRIANDNAASSTRALQFGMMDLGRQLSDVSTMWALGARPMQIFASQSGQIIQSFQIMSGGASRLAGFLTGPWGIALTTATLALTPLIGRLFDTKSAAEQVEFATYGLSDAQGILGSVMDLTTGKISTQKDALLALAHAQILSGQVQARQDTANARKALGGITAYSAKIEGGFGGGLRLSRTRGVEADVVSAFMDGSLNTQEAVRGLNSLAKSGLITDDAFTKAAKAVTDFALAQENLKVFENADKALGGDKSALTQFLKPGRSSKKKLSEEAKALKQRNEETERYISTLNDEIAKIGKTPGQLRQLEIARAKEAAATESQRKEIEALNQKREEALSVQAREEALAQNDKALAALNERLHALDDEYALLGLVGPAREKAALKLEEEAFKAKAAADGIIDVDAAWQRYLSTRSRNIDARTALERDAESARILADEMQRLVGKVIDLGGVGEALGGLLGFATGNFGAIRGPAGVLLQTVIGTTTDSQGRVIARTLGDELRHVFGDGGEFAKSMEGALKSAGIGAIAGSAIFGKQSAEGQIGSALGGIIGEKAGKALTDGLGGLLGSAGGPVGSIVGGVLGGALGGIFGKRPRGAAEVTNSSVYGHTNDNALTQSITGFGTDVQGAVQRIADALGVTVGTYDVGLGRYKDYYQVSSRAGDPRLGKTYFGNKSQYALYDGKDPTAAAAAALGAAIADGAIKGLSATAERILKNTPNIDDAIKRVLDFRGVFDELRAYSDPIGAAIDELDKQFSHLKDVFNAAGASTAEYAKLEELYGLKRADVIKQTMDRISGSLNDLLRDLNMGGMGLSLRDREKAAQANYDALASRVRTGDTSAYDSFAEAARTLLGIERQIYGSQSAYFATFDNVRDLTKSTLDQQKALFDAASGRDSPFSSSGAAKDNQGVIDGLSSLGDRLVEEVGGRLADRLDAVNQNLGTLIAGQTQSLPTRLPLVGTGGYY